MHRVSVCSEPITEGIFEEINAKRNRGGEPNPGALSRASFESTSIVLLGSSFRVNKPNHSMAAFSFWVKEEFGPTCLYYAHILQRAE